LPLLTTGLSLEGWLEASLKIMQKSLSDPDTLLHWRTQMRALVHARFDSWSRSPDPINLFRSLSDLTMTYLLYLIMGTDFAERHAEEVVPMVRKYETAMQRPETKLLPRWMTPAGRYLTYVEARMQVLVGAEVETRCRDMQRYKGNVEYIQQVLNRVGDKFKEGTSTLVSR